jgi:hypothetical protein
MWERLWPGQALDLCALSWDKRGNFFNPRLNTPMGSWTQDMRGSYLVHLTNLARCPFAILALKTFMTILKSIWDKGFPYHRPLSHAKLFHQALHSPKFLLWRTSISWTSRYYTTLDQELNLSKLVARKLVIINQMHLWYPTWGELYVLFVCEALWLFVVPK